MVTLQDIKAKLDQVAADVAAVKAAQPSGVVVAQADLDAVAAAADALDASVKALATPPAA